MVYVTKILWEYDKRTKNSIIDISIIFDLLTIGLAVLSLRKVDFSNFNEATVAGLILGFGWMLVGLTHFDLKTKNYLFGKTVAYRLMENHIEFEYGIFHRRVDVIPYESIIAINKYSSRNKTSTITIYSTVDVNYVGINEETHQLEDLPSLDEIPNGDEAYQIIKNKIAANDFDTLRRNYTNEIVDEAEGRKLSKAQKLWNVVMAYIYMVYVLIYLIAVIDVTILSAKPVNDTISKVEHFSVPHNSEAFYDIYTKKGYHFVTFEPAGRAGDEVIMQRSKVFKLYLGLVVNGRDKSDSLYNETNGLMPWILTLFALYILIAGLSIFATKGVIRADERGFLTLGPFFVIILTYLSWVLFGQA